jgi:hypothetical protein
VTIGIIQNKREVVGKGTSYYIDYAYRLEPDVWERGKINVPKKLYGAAQVGGMVAVFYDPENPRRSVPHGYDEFGIESF